MAKGTTMTNLPQAWSRWLRASSACLVLAPLACLAALADEPSTSTSTTAANTPARGREIFEALRKLQISIQGDPADADRPPAEMPTRPARVVQTPTLDAARVDALFDRL